MMGDLMSYCVSIDGVLEGHNPGEVYVDDPAAPQVVLLNGPDGIVGTEDDNLYLLSYSRCINAGDPTVIDTGQTDMDGQIRVRYGRVDMGAYEVFPIAGDFNEPDVPPKAVP